jgi:transcriptional regulator GlxA family with amidase domain
MADSTADDPERFGALTSWMSQHLAQDLSVEALARAHRDEPAQLRAPSSPEHCACRRRANVQSLRIDAARRLLTDGRMSIERIADRCGFASAEGHAHRVPARAQRLPQRLRARFRSAS